MTERLPSLKTLILLGLLGLAATLAAADSMQPALAADLSPEAQAAPTVAPDTSGPAADLVPVPEPSAEALRYHHSGNLLWIVATAWGLLVPGLILFSGFSARLRDWAQGAVRGWFPVVAVYTLLYLVTVYLLDLPLSWYQGYVRQHEFGLSNQSLGLWLGDSLKALLVMLVIGVATVWVPYLLLRRSPRRWWLYTGLAAVPFLLLALLIQPVLIAPLFDDFGPMQDKALEAEILALAERAGIDGGRVLEVNKRADTAFWRVRFSSASK